ncbi:MAG: LysR family transcriptional regulator [Qingshengfaniella sp.]
MDRMTEMEAFTTVVEQGGFTGAAKRLGVSKSAVSKHVSSLEARLDVKLLDRTTRRVAPTEIGLAFYERARTVLGAVQDAEQMIAEKNVAPEGFLRVAVMDALAGCFIAAHLTAFLQAHPGLNLHLGQTDGYVELKGDGFELAVGTAMADIGKNSLQLGELRFVLVAAPDYVARAGAPARIEDLSNHDILNFSGDNGDAKFHLVSRSGERRPIHTPGRLIVRDTATVMAALLDGLGIGFVPLSLVEAHLGAGRLVEVLTDLPPQVLPVHVSHRPGDQINPKVRAFLSHFGAPDQVGGRGQ